MVRRHGREDDQVDLVLRHSGALDRLPGRRRAEVRRGRARVDVVAGLDSAALANPLVAGVHDPGQHLVGDAVRRDLRSAPDDDGSLHVKHLPGPRQPVPRDARHCSPRPRDRRLAVTSTPRSSSRSPSRLISVYAGEAPLQKPTRALQGGRGHEAGRISCPSFAETSTAPRRSGSARRKSCPRTAGARRTPLLQPDRTC